MPQNALKNASRNARRTLLACLLGALPLAGCLAAATPSARVIDAQVIDDDGRVATLRLDIQTTNNDENTLALRRVDYTVSVEGAEPFTAARSAELTLPPGATSSFSLPAIIPSPSVGQPITIDARIFWVPPRVFTRSLWEADFYKPNVALRDTRTPQQ